MNDTMANSNNPTSSQPETGGRHQNHDPLINLMQKLDNNPMAAEVMKKALAKTTEELAMKERNQTE